MFDIGWPELLVIATILIVVVGPKDLPHMLRTFGRTMRKVRSMAAEFRGQFDDALRDAELEELRKTVDDVKGLNPRSAMQEAMAPFKKAGEDVRKTLDEDDDVGFDAAVMEPLDEPEFDPSDIEAGSVGAPEASVENAAAAQPGVSKDLPAKPSRSAKSGAATTKAKPKAPSANSKAPAKTGAAAKTSADRAKPSPLSKPGQRSGGSKATASTKKATKAGETAT